jgi:putative spermidine/putrescine transport system substrate-binding protein
VTEEKLMDPIEQRLRFLLSLRGRSPQADAFSRRELFKLSARYAVGGSALAAFLAACGNSQTTPTPTSGSSGSGGTSSPGTTSPAAEITLPEMKPEDVPDNLKGSGEVVAISYGGAYQDAQRKAYFEPFEQLCGITVKEAEGPDLAKIKAMVDTGNVQWDLPEVGLDGIIALERQGDYWEPINYDLVDVDNIDEAFRHDNAIAMNPYGLIYGYRTDAFDGTPSGWADFWDTEKFPGPRAMEGGSGGLLPMLEAAVMAAGVPMDKLYPLDIDQAYDSLKKIKPDVVKWWDAGAQPVQMLNDKEAVMAQAWSGRILTLKSQNPGIPVEIAWNQGQLAFDVWGIPKGAPNKENAQKLAAFSTLPISQARLSMLYPNGFVNNKSVDYIPAEIASTLATSPEHKQQMYVQDDNWWADNREDILNRWNQFILS